MGRYVVRRLLWAVLVMLITTLLAFLIFFVLPSADPSVSLGGKSPDAATREEIKKDFGLDKPLPVQYGLWVKKLATGDEYGWPGFGKSYSTRQGVHDELIKRMWVTLQLAIGALILWLAVGVTIGALSALRRHTWVDRAAMTFALIGISTPVFFLGLLSLYVFWYRLGIAPGTGYVPMTESPTRWLSQMIMPWIVLAMLFAAVYARVTRGNMLEVMGEDYIRTARAKGIPSGQVVTRHILRSSLTPVVTLAGIDFATLISSAVVTESVFSIPGVGAYVLDAVFSNDLPIVMAVTLITAIFVTVIGLIVDIIYAILDPRVRLQ